MSRALLFALIACALPGFSQQFDPSLYGAMRWRQIGPFRAGRVSAVAGIPGNAAVYYMGTPGGGVWKTENGGVVWHPIFDREHVSSIGAIVVSPSNPDIIYVGTGDVSNVGGAVNQGNGVYKSIDAGKSWQHVGLDDSRHIGAMWVDPHNPDIVVVAALGHTFAPNSERGVFKTTDGGKMWRKVLHKDDVTGAIDVVFAPDNSKIGFAALWGHYVKPGNTRSMIDNISSAAIYKTADGGDTWKQIATSTLPGERLGRIGLAVAPGGERVFAIIAADRANNGLYRSNDGGSSWQRITSDPRIQGSGYFSRVFLDPKNSDIVYVAQTSLYRSEDGGKTFIAYKGAPGGDDNHALWIDPANSDRMILASDQGATISMDAGKSWSSWYNQPTGQIYHLSVDNRFPYWVYGTQQDSGSVGTLSRGDYGEITFMDWDPVGGYEFGYIVPDPLNPNLVYAGGPARGLVRIDRANRQVATVSPNVSRDGDYRTAMNPPIAMDPRVDVSTTALDQQLQLQKKLVDLVAVSFDFYHQAALVRQALAVGAKKLEAAPSENLDVLKKFDAEALKLQGQDTGFGGGGNVGKPKPTFALLNRELSSLESTVDLQDAAPTPAMITAYQDYCHDLTNVANGWNELLHTNLSGVNDALSKGRLAALPATPLRLQFSCQ